MEIQKIVSAQKKFSENYNKRVSELNKNFQQCLQDMQKEYDAHMKDLDDAVKKIQSNYKIVSTMNDE